MEIAEKTGILVRSIKTADKMYPGWRQLDYYHKFALLELPKPKIDVSRFVIE